MATRLSIAKPDMVKLFEGLPDRILRQRDIARILHENRDSWRLTKGTTVALFIKFLLESTMMRRVRLKLPHRPETLFVWGEVSPYVLATRSKPNAYLCHYTAMHLLGLTDQVPETIYANHEQRPVPPPSEPPTQERVDAAFRRPQRMTSNIAEMGARQLCLINGKHTGGLGVVEMQDDNHQTFRVTGLERTLIDVTVRPYYAGGVSEVLEAYRRAADRVSLNKLSATLKKMEFVYPYDQAVGFYLERSGAYEPSRLGLFRRRTFTLDFYLSYAMAQTDYSARWRLFFPTGL